MLIGSESGIKFFQEDWKLSTKNFLYANVTGYHVQK